ncbi:MAG: PQQ-dependent sugar dehydrogenase [Chloroflexota bacterium]|nr:PQQ-dependent sugar dehydrogenase [Chloroflexota bacterium]
MHRFTDRALLACLLVTSLLLAACQPFPSGTAGSDTDGTVAAEVVGIPAGLGVETVVEGLEIPWDLAFTPDGRILITERPGRIRVVKEGTLQATPYATIEVFHRSEAGLMGIALHPEFDSNGYLYVCYTYREGLNTYNRIARLTDQGDRGADHHVILDHIPGATRHDGCRIRFGPDGYLYATTGDATDPSLSQDLDSLAGKVLRMGADGSVPPDNPFAGSLVYTWGHRNPQGLDWHPATGEPFITEHGPSEDDEVNVLEPGKNYGWPEATGAPGIPGYVDSALALTPTVAIAGAAFVTGYNKLPDAWSGDLIFAALKSSHLQRVELEPPDYRTVASRQTLFQGQFGRLRAVVMGPDGYLYFTTSNRDGRGSPRDGDDKLLRLGPLSSTPDRR